MFSPLDFIAKGSSPNGSAPENGSVGVWRLGWPNGSSKGVELPHRDVGCEEKNRRTLEWRAWQVVWEGGARGEYFLKLSCTVPEHCL